MSNTLRNQIERVLDTWSTYDYKENFLGTRPPLLLPGWVGADNLRRLRAYGLLESYYSNSSRHWLEDSSNKKDRREYGDPFVIVETTMTSLVGDEQHIVVEGALAAGEEEDKLAMEAQEALDQWAEDEKFYMKMLESERQSVKYGDSIYILGWDEKKQRPRLNVYDPGFYFPVFDDMARGSEDYPTKVHIAYEFEKELPSGDCKMMVRRITWELKTVEAYTTSYGTQATENCLYQDMVIELAEIGKDIDTFSGRTYQWITEPVFMNVDFVPVVHVPNTVNLQGHFGKSVLSPVLQIIDDLQSTDTDVQAATATTGSPVIVITGRGTGAAEQTTYGPGLIMYVGEGDAHIMDTSTALTALMQSKDSLLERLSVNSRIPESLLGRVKPNEVPSGITLTLSFTPHSRMVKEMRLVREQKYSLLFKFVLRMFGFTDPPKARLSFGTFLPADKQEASTIVQQLLTSKAISLETAVQMLGDAGIPVEDWVEEIARIQSRDVDTANQLVTLTGDPNTGLDYMGLPNVDPDALLPDPDADPTQDPNADPTA
jgi:hypothetical protein